MRRGLFTMSRRMPMSEMVLKSSGAASLFFFAGFAGLVFFANPRAGGDDAALRVSGEEEEEDEGKEEEDDDEDEEKEKEDEDEDEKDEAP